MKRVVTHIGLSILLGTFCICYADNEKKGGTQDKGEQATVEKGSADKKSKKSLSPVAKALSKLHCFNGKPMKDAKYYVYLQSASWCGPCREEMPKIVEAYKEMKAAGIEIILVGRDYSAKEAKDYLKMFKAKFPGFFSDKKDKIELPGFTLSGSVPHATFVDAEGNVLKDGHGSITLQWKEIIPADTAEQPDSGEE